MKCRHCGQPLHLTFLDLGSAPPSNAYLSEAALRAPTAGTGAPLSIIQFWDRRATPMTKPRIAAIVAAATLGAAAFTGAAVALAADETPSPSASESTPSRGMEGPRGNDSRQDGPGVAEQCRGVGAKEQQHPRDVERVEGEQGEQPGAHRAAAFQAVNAEFQHRDIQLQTGQ